MHTHAARYFEYYFYNPKYPIICVYTTATYPLRAVLFSVSLVYCVYNVASISYVRLLCVVVDSKQQSQNPKKSHERNADMG